MASAQSLITEVVVPPTTASRSTASLPTPTSTEYISTMVGPTTSIPVEVDVKRWIPQLLAAMPTDWRGTTFRNSHLLGRVGFADNLKSLLYQKAKNSSSELEITESELTDVGNAEDYLRVATNLSVTLELALAAKAGIESHFAFTFGSKTMQMIAVALVAKDLTVHIYHGTNEAAPFTQDEINMISLFGATIELHADAPKTHPDGIVLAYSSVADVNTAGVDGVVSPNILLIASDKIEPDDVLVIRKRMATPVTTPVAEAMLQSLSDMPVTANLEAPSAEGTDGFLAHLQTLAGTDVNTEAQPIVFTAGLPTLASLWTALAGRGGADVVMCSTAYGGSNQLADIVNNKVDLIHKHTFDIQGLNTNLVERIDEKLSSLADDANNLAPTTVLFVEVPTNPDMKVPDVNAIATSLHNYANKSGKNVILLIDATFAPGSKVLHQLKAVAPELPAMVFTSLSKSVSRGLTTGGALVANHTNGAISLLHDVRKAARLFDTESKTDQMLRLVQNHNGVEERCRQAYLVAKEIGEALQGVVHSSTGKEMKLAFVHEKHAKLGFTSSTFSFNLPVPADASASVTAALAQRFVDLLTEHKEFKPCVSFGQDNGLVYATVPATSTQGAIKEEDKAKQAVGGVQLVRLSFPPKCDNAKVIEIVRSAVTTIYA